MSLLVVVPKGARRWAGGQRAGCPSSEGAQSKLVKTDGVSLGIVRTALWAEGRAARMNQEGTRLVPAIALGSKQTCAG